MNDPIISPWLILLLGNLNTVNCFLGVVTIISIVWTAVNGCSYYSGVGEEVITSKSFHKLIGVTVILLLLNMFIPSRDTAIAMVVASKITPITVTETKEQVKDMIDYTVDKINSTKK